LIRESFRTHPALPACDFVVSVRAPAVTTSSPELRELLAGHWTRAAARLSS